MSNMVSHIWYKFVPQTVDHMRYTVYGYCINLPTLTLRGRVIPVLRTNFKTGSQTECAVCKRRGFANGDLHIRRNLQFRVERSPWLLEQNQEST